MLKKNEVNANNNNYTCGNRKCNLCQRIQSERYRSSCRWPLLINFSESSFLFFVMKFFGCEDCAHIKRNLFSKRRVIKYLLFKSLFFFSIKQTLVVVINILQG